MKHVECVVMTKPTIPRSAPLPSQHDKPAAREGCTPPGASAGEVRGPAGAWAFDPTHAVLSGLWAGPEREFRQNPVWGAAGMRLPEPVVLRGAFVARFEFGAAAAI
jgi:hypothetical protein